MTTTTTIILAAALVLAIAGALELERRRRSWRRFASAMIRERDDAREGAEGLKAELREARAEALGFRDEATRAGVLAEQAQHRRRELERRLAELGREHDALERTAHELEAELERQAQPDELVGRELVVHTRRPDDQSIRGVCVYSDALELRLIGAQYLSGREGAPLGGEVRILRAHVAFSQVLDAPELAGAAEPAAAAH